MLRWGWMARCALVAAGAGSSIVDDGRAEEIRGGASIQSVRAFSPNTERGAAIAGDVILEPFSEWRAVGRPRFQAGVSVATDDAATSFIHGGLVWRIDRPASRFYLDLGAGIAIHDGETAFDPDTDFSVEGSAFLGCRALFRLQAAPGVWLNDRLSLSLQFEHLSNASICSPNEGLDNIGLRLGTRF